MTEDEVSSEPVDSPITTTGTDHITVSGTDPEATLEFYRDLLGMPLVMSQPNLDRPHLTHLFFDTGDGRILTFFVDDDRDVASDHSPDDGGVHHLAFGIEAGELQEVKQSLEEAGYGVSEFDRGAFHSLYTSDPNGLTIELVADKYVVPDDRRGEVMALAHHKRVADGAEYVKDEHMQAALDEMDIEYEVNEIPDAPAGVGVDD